MITQQTTSFSLTRDKLIVLGVVNTMQPVTHDVLASATSTLVDRRRLRSVVNSLRSQLMLTRLPSGEYVVSRKGRDALVTSALRTRRDVSRMRYLFERSKGGGAQA